MFSEAHRDERGAQQQSALREEISLRFTNHLSVPVMLIIERYEPSCDVPEQSYLGRSVVVGEASVRIQRRLLLVPIGGSVEAAHFMPAHDQFLATRFNDDFMDSAVIIDEFVQSPGRWQGPWQVTAMQSKKPHHEIHLRVSESRSDDQSAPILVDSETISVTRGSVASMAHIWCDTFGARPNRSSRGKIGAL